MFEYNWWFYSNNLLDKIAKNAINKLARPKYLYRTITSNHTILPSVR